MQERESLYFAFRGERLLRPPVDKGAIPGDREGRSYGVIASQSADWRGERAVRCLR